MFKGVILTQILKIKSPFCLRSFSFLAPVWILLCLICAESPSRPGGSQLMNMRLCVLVGCHPLWHLQICMEVGVSGLKPLLQSNRLSFKGTL